MVLRRFYEKNYFSIAILCGLASSVSAASWYYGADGCTKIYAYGYNASKCFYKARNIKKEAARKFLCRYKYCFWATL